MKIVCESCGAKYSIADERVSGKVFKIRCKRCSEVIVVRGDQQSAPAAAPAQTQEQAGIWHVVLDGEQAGPYSPSQLGEMINAGTIDWEAYVWTEGFDNWLPLREVEDLVAQITGQPQESAAMRPAQRASVTETLTGQPSMGADPFAEDAAPSGGMFGGAASSTGPDLFARGQGAPSPFAGSSDRDGVVASSASRAGAAVDSSLTGARNENSVLFSLKNLQALATASSSPSIPVGGGDRPPGFAGGEGSGLIDIRALASATGITNGAASPEKDDLLSLGTQGGAFGALGSPMLAPVSDSGDGNKKLLIWAGVAAVGVLSMAGVAIAYLLVNNPAQPQQPVGMVVPPTEAPAVAAPAAVAAEPVAPSEGELAAAAAEKEKNEAQESTRSGSTSRPRREGSGTSTKEPSGTSDPIATREERKAPAAPSGSRDIDSLLNEALSKGSSAKPTRATEESAPRSDLPDTPSKEAVLAAMGSVKSAVSACGNGQGGVATVTVSVAGTTGRVTNAQVDGVTGPAGSCVAQAVRKAQFPKFQQKVFKLKFPFKL